MITCARASKLIQQYSDGRLDMRRLADLETHLATCSTCQKEFAWLDIIRAACLEDEPVSVPDDLTDRVMAYIAQAEAQQSHKASRAFALRWGDGVLAVLLASLSTLVFALLDPQLRAVLGTLLSHTLPNSLSFLMQPGPGSFPWAAWIVWVVAGVGLSVAFAGAQVRFLWRRSLAPRLPQLPSLPQIPQLW